MEQLAAILARLEAKAGAQTITPSDRVIDRSFMSNNPAVNTLARSIEEQVNNGFLGEHFIFQKIFQGDIAAVKDYAEKGGDLRRATSFGFPLLKFSAKYGNTAILKWLIEEAVRVQKNCKVFTSDEMQGLLLLTVEQGDEESVAYLLSLKLNWKNEKARSTGDNPLTLAAAAGFPAIVELLLNANLFDINSLDNNGCTPLILACMRNEPKVSQPILTIIANVSILDNDSDEELYRKAKLGAENTTDNQMLSQKNKMVRRILSNHPKSDFSKVIEILISRKADKTLLDVNESSALHYAAKCGTVSDLKLLLSDLPAETCNQIDVYGASAVEYSLIRRKEGRSAEDQHEECISLLLAHPNINLNSRSTQHPILITALFSGYSPLVIKKILERKIDVNERAERLDNMTALSAAIFVWKDSPQILKEIVLLLIQAGADVNVVHHDHMPLGTVVQLGDKHYEVAELLLDSGAKFYHTNTVKYDRASPVVIAFENLRSERLAQLFVKRDPKCLLACHEFAVNPLFAAIGQDNEKMIEFLVPLYTKEMLNDPKCYGLAPALNVAINKRNHKCIQALLKQGAELRFDALTNGSSRASALKEAVNSQDLEIVQEIFKLTMSSTLIDDDRKFILVFEAFEKSILKRNLAIVKFLFFCLTSFEENDLDLQEKLFERIFARLFIDLEIFKVENTVDFTEAKTNIENVFLALLDLKECEWFIKKFILNFIVSCDVGDTRLFDKLIDKVTHEWQNELATEHVLNAALLRALQNNMTKSVIKLIGLKANKTSVLANIILQESTTSNPEFSQKCQEQIDTLNLSLQDITVSFRNETALMLAQTLQSKLLPKLLGKMIWLSLKDTFFNENAKQMVIMNACRQEFSKYFSLLVTEFQVDNSALIWLPYKGVSIRLSFSNILEMFKLVVLERIEKGKFNFQNLNKFIFKQTNLYIDETKIKQERNQLLNDINLENVENNFNCILPGADNRTVDEFLATAIDLGLVKEGIQKAEETKLALDNVESSNTFQNCVHRINQLMSSSNSFLCSEVAVHKLADKRAGYQAANDALKKRVSQIETELLDLRNRFYACLQSYLNKFSSLAEPIKVKLVENDLALALSLKAILDSDKGLNEDLNLRLNLIATIQEKQAELLRIETKLLEQRQTEENMKVGFSRKKKAKKQKNELLVKERELLEKKQKEEAVYRKFQLELQQRQRAEQLCEFRLNKEKRRAYWVEKIANSLKAREAKAKAEADASLGREPKTTHEQQYLFEQRNSLLSKSSSALTQVVAHIKEKEAAEKSAETLLCERLACFGLSAHIAEIFYREGGILGFSESEAEHFRNVIWHAKKSFLDKFSNEEVVELAYLFSSILINDLEEQEVLLKKCVELLKNNSVFRAIFSYALEYEPSPFSVYHDERKQEKEDEAIYRSINNTSPSLVLEHAYRFTVGRLGAIADAMQKHYVKNFEDDKQLQEEFRLYNKQLRLDVYRYLGRQARHAIKDPLELVMSNWTRRVGKGEEDIQLGLEDTRILTESISGLGLSAGAWVGAGPGPGIGVVAEAETGEGAGAGSFTPLYRGLPVVPGTDIVAMVPGTRSKATRKPTIAAV